MENIKDIVYLEDKPKYIQIADKFKELIDSGNIKDGEKLPPIRELTKILNVNKITVVNAYKKLNNEGFAYQKIGSGTFAKKKELHSNFMKIYSNTFKFLKNCNYFILVWFRSHLDTFLILLLLQLHHHHLQLLLLLFLLKKV